MRNKTLNLILIASLVCSQTSWAAKGNDFIETKQKKIILIKQSVEATLKQKAMLVPSELSGTLTGQITGTVNGDFGQKSRISSALGYGLIGALAGAALGPLGTIPYLINTSSLILSGAALGGAAGAGAGILLPEKVAEGHLQGNIDGKFEGKSWDNIYDARLWMALVIDPEQFKDTKNRSECLDKYTKMLNEIEKTGKFFTQLEADQLLKNVSQMSANVNELELDSINLESGEQIALDNFIATQKAWMNKKINFIQIGAQGLMIKKTDVYNVKLKSDIIHYFDGDWTPTSAPGITPTEFEVFAGFSSQDTARRFLKKYIDDIHSAAKNLILSTQKKIDSIKIIFYDPISIIYLNNLNISTFQIDKKGSISFIGNNNTIQILAPKYILVKPNVDVLVSSDGGQLCSEKSDLQRFIKSSAQEKSINFNQIN